METIIDYVMRLEMEKEIDALELWSKWNIQNYLSNPEESKDKNYSKKQQKIRKKANISFSKKNRQLL